MSKSGRMRLAGNVARVRDRDACWVLVRKDERKRVIGRHNYRWKDNTKMGLRESIEAVDGIDPAEEK
jgi:hypothetical protein